MLERTFDPDTIPRFASAEKLENRTHDGLAPSTSEANLREPDSHAKSTKIPDAIARIGSGIIPRGKNPSKLRDRKNGRPTLSPDREEASEKSENPALQVLRHQFELERQIETDPLTQKFKEEFENDRESEPKKFAYAAVLARSRRKQRRKKSIRLFQEILRADGSKDDINYRRDVEFYYAKALFWNEEYPKCLDILNKILSTCPNHQQVQIFRSLLFEDYADQLAQTKLPRESVSPIRHRVGSGNPIDKLSGADRLDGDRGSRRAMSSSAKRVLSGPSQAGNHTFAQAIQEDTSEMIESIKKSIIAKKRFKGLLEQLNPGFDISLNPTRELLGQWECFPDSGLSSNPSNRIYLFTDMLIYACLTPTSPIPFVAQKMYPLYKVMAESSEVPRSNPPVFQFSLCSRPPDTAAPSDSKNPAPKGDQLLVVYTRYAQLAAMIEAINFEASRTPVLRPEMVRVSIHDSESLMSLGLSRTHKAIAITQQTTADQMRKVLIEKMCSSLPVHHVQVISTECVDYRIYRSKTTTGEESVFESNDTPLRFLAINPEFSLVFKPYPPRRPKGHHAIIVDERQEGQGKVSITETAPEEDQGLIRVYFCDTPLLAHLEYNSDTFKTLFIRSDTTTAQICKIIINKITDYLGSDAERANVSQQLDAYRIWGLSVATGRGLFLDVASHPWKIYKRAILQDPTFRFVFSPSLNQSIEPVSTVTTSGSHTRRNWKRWKTRPQSKISVGQPQVFKQHLRVDEDFNWSGEDPQKSFQIIKQVGSGAYGSVFLASHLATGKRLVIKEVFCGQDPQSVAAIESEIGILKQCRHPDIVGYYGCCRKSENDLWIFMDYCEHGSLATLISHLPSKCLSQIQAVSILSHVIKGLEYLHTLNVVHRDIKSANILINAAGEVKIADFGISKQLSSIEALSVLGTPHFMSPEAVDGQPVSTSTDIWSVGITLIEMVEGKPPHHDKPAVQVMYAILCSDPPTLQEPQRFSPEFSSFIAACLLKDESKRPSASDLLFHPLLEPQSSIMEIIASVSQPQPKKKVIGSQSGLSLDFDSPHSYSSSHDPSLLDHSHTLQDIEHQIDLMTRTRATERTPMTITPPLAAFSAHITPDESSLEDILGISVPIIPLETQLDIEVVEDHNTHIFEFEQEFETLPPSEVSQPLSQPPHSPPITFYHDEPLETIASDGDLFLEETID